MRARTEIKIKKLQGSGRERDCTWKTDRDDAEECEQIAG